jgi:segregation and condensation protein B
MDFDLKKTLEALLLSTAEPITLKDLVRIFARHHLELSQVLDDAKDDKDEEAELMEVPSLVTQAQIRDMLIVLTDEAEVQDKAYRVVEGPNGYQIVTAPQFAEFVRL